MRRTANLVALLAAILTAASGLPAAGGHSPAAYPRPGSYQRVSGLPVGEANGGSTGISMTRDGRYVAFSSEASNLVPGDTNGVPDVFVTDRTTGRVERVSVSSSGAQAAPPAGRTQWLGSWGPSITTDGRYVAFVSQASNFAPGRLLLGQEIYVRDRVLGTTEPLTAIDPATGARVPVGESDWPSFSATGRYLAFRARRPITIERLWDTSGPVATTAWQVYVLDRSTGRLDLVSARPDGSFSYGQVDQPAISDDGRWLSFGSSAPDLVAGTTTGCMDIMTNCFQMFLRDRKTRRTRLVSRGLDGEPTNWIALQSSISANGRYVAYVGTGTDLTPTRTFDEPPVLVYDRDTGTTTRASVTSAGAEMHEACVSPAISADGRHVAYRCSRRTSTGSITFDPSTVYVTDLATRTTELVGRYAGQQGVNQPVAISADGRLVGFSTDDALVPGDRNKAEDVFVRDRGTVLGVLQATATRGSGSTTVAGLATFSGATVLSGRDVANDAQTTAVGAGRGQELTRLDVVYRPELADLLVELAVDRLPYALPPGPPKPPGGPGFTVVVPTPAVAGDLRLVYVVRLTVGGRAYEVRGRLLPAAAAPPFAADFGLYDCIEVSCTRIADLAGAIGTTGHHLRVAVPLAAVHAAPGGMLSGVRALAALSAYEPGLPATVLDELAVRGAARLPAATVRVTARPETGPAAELVAAVVRGRFSVRHPARSGYRYQARACLGTRCSAAITLPLR